MIYDPLAGIQIIDAFREAHRLSSQHQTTVSMKFNGIDYDVVPSDTVERLVGKWQSDLDQKEAEYRESPQYEIDQENHRQQLENQQKEVDRMLSTVDEHIRNGVFPAVTWLAEFSEVADWGGLVYDRVSLAKKFEIFAERGQHVGRKDLKDPANRQALAEYIIGQAIDVLYRGYPPHPMTRIFAAEL